MELRSSVEPHNVVSGDGELHDLDNGAVGSGASYEHSLDGGVRHVFGIEVGRSTALLLPNHRW
jgi:hypothetical protein